MFTFIDIKHLMNKLKNAKICEKAPLTFNLFDISFNRGHLLSKINAHIKFQAN